ncbi:MAG: IS4 family transposase [Acidobacteria bacterium]|nr:IS4 family transposase [Acidobacteriota bacterium]
MAQSDPKNTKVDLLAVVEVCYAHLTKPLCDEVFQEEREAERERKWTLHAMATFWTEVTLRAPKALTQALQECAQGEGAWPAVQASEAAFFGKSADLRPGFFQTIFERFLESILPEAQPLFVRRFRKLYKRFPEVWVLDGSKLSAIWHRLKALWPVRSVVLPGSLLVLYDWRRGIPRYFRYCGDAARAEVTRALEALSQVPAGTLLVADRLFAVPKFFGAVTRQGAWIVARRNGLVKPRTVERLSRRRHRGGWLEDTLVDVGPEGDEGSQRWRHIRWQKGAKVFEVMTNVLDPRKLSASEAVDLYEERWTIERMFYDLKEVLNLNRIYLSHANGVAQQVYAAALVYTALRVAQGHVARAHRLEPERISVPKFFPRVCAAAASYTAAKITLDAVVELNPHRNLALPNLKDFRFASTALSAILVEKRSERRRKRRFCKARSRWKSFAHIPGTRKMARS